MRYTKDGKDFLRLGGHTYYDNQFIIGLTEEWLLQHGYVPYAIVEGDGTDGIVDNQWVHYVEPVNLEENEFEE